MEDRQQVPAPRRQRRTGERLLTVGLGAVVLVAVTAVARADVTQLFSGQTNKPVQSGKGGAAASAAATANSNAPAAASASDPAAQGKDAANDESEAIRRGNTSGRMGTYNGKVIILPSTVAPPADNRVTTILRGTGVVVFTCTRDEAKPADNRGAAKPTATRTAAPTATRAAAATVTLAAAATATRSTAKPTATRSVFKQTEVVQNLFTLRGNQAGITFGAQSWASSRDGSRVDAALVKEEAVKRSAPLALFRARAADGGRGLFERTSFVVQLPLSGGDAPSRCTEPGKRISVPFQSLYVFFRSTAAEKPIATQTKAPSATASRTASAAPTKAPSVTTTRAPSTAPTGAPTGTRP